MIEDFRTAIGVACLVKQEMMELDQNKIWSYHLPEVAATEEQLLQAERRLGHVIDAHYRAFLKCANGWKSFFQDVDLFGTDDLTGGPRRERAEFILSYLDDAVLKKQRSDGRDAIAADRCCEIGPGSIRPKAAVLV